MNWLRIGILLSMGGVPALAGDLHEDGQGRSCGFAERHVPAPDVVYEPGRDVHGRPVRGADVEGSPAIDLPPSFGFTMTVAPLHDRFRRRLSALDGAIAALALGAPERGRLVAEREALVRRADRISASSSVTTMALGSVDIDAASGAVTYDGQPLGPAGNAASFLACR